MLTTDSYMIAWSIYALATVGGLFLLDLWLRKHLGRVARFTVLLTLAVMALTPAHPDTGVTTWAPAILVGGFELLTHGPASAIRALLPILMMVTLALVVGLVLTLVGWFARRD